jgi:hypothetical protein
VTGPGLKPWSLAPLVTVLAAAMVALMAFVGTLMVVAAPSLDVTVVSKGFILLLAIAGIGCAVSTAMWTRYWREVQWDVGFWTFISGPPPEYDEARLAWQWGRRFAMCWIVLMLCVFGVPVVEQLAQKWR